MALELPCIRARRFVFAMPGCLAFLVALRHGRDATARQAIPPVRQVARLVEIGARAIPSGTLQPTPSLPERDVQEVSETGAILIRCGVRLARRSVAARIGR